MHLRWPRQLSGRADTPVLTSGTAHRPRGRPAGRPSTASSSAGRQGSKGSKVERVLVPLVLRDARRRRGLSVRAAAQLCDVPRGTWAGWEAGASSPTGRRLDEALRALRLDLRLVARQDEPPGRAQVARHLRRSLTTRACLALADQLRTVVAACRSAPRLLTGPAAVGVWVPHVIARGPLPLPIVRSDPALVSLWLPDGTRSVQALVITPASLLSAGADELWPALRTSERLLSLESPRDTAGRRLPAHRLPDEEREIRDLMHTLTWGARAEFPVATTDSRAWRLGAPASLDEALERQRLPPRHRH